MPDPIAEAYADCIDHRCPNCGAAAGAYCVNPINELPRGTPCLVRIAESEPE